MEVMAALDKLDLIYTINGCYGSGLCWQGICTNVRTSNTVGDCLFCGET